ncbi:unnamed protein product, partial [Oikopleura dioica]
MSERECEIWDRVSYKLGCLSIKSTFSGSSPGKENETDSGVNSMDFQEKLKLSDEEVIVTPSCHLPPIPAPRRMPEPTSHGRHQQSHHRSISVDRRDENSNGMSRLQTAKSRAAHIRARSKDRQNFDSMSSCSGYGAYSGGTMDRGRSRYRRNSDAASEMASLPPSGYGMGLGHRQRQGSVSSLLSNRSGKDLIFGLEEFEAQNKIDLDHERAEAAREKERMAQIATMRDRPCAIKDRIRELEGQLDENLQSLRMEKALVSGELREEENMLEIESSQLENNIRGQGSGELAKELEMTLRDRKRRVDALKNQLVILDAEMREETLRLNAERDEQIIALQREEKQMMNRFQRKAPSYCTGPRVRRPRARSNSGFSYDGGSVLSVDSYGSTANSNWIVERASQLAQAKDSEKHVEEMKKLLMEVQEEKERLMRSLASASEEPTGGMTSPGYPRANSTFTNHTRSNSVGISQSGRNPSDSVFDQSVISPVKDSMPPSSNPSISDIGASASQYGNDQVTMRSSVSPEGDARRKENRPMTRYVANACPNLDLRTHLEAQGHNPRVTDALDISPFAIRGKLSKLASRKKRRPWKRWKNRWVLFDRRTRSLQWF